MFESSFTLSLTTVGEYGTKVNIDKVTYCVKKDNSLTNSLTAYLLDVHCLYFLPRKKLHLLNMHTH